MYEVTHKQNIERLVSEFGEGKREEIRRLYNKERKSYEELADKYTAPAVPAATFDFVRKILEK